MGLLVDAPGSKTTAGDGMLMLQASFMKAYMHVYLDLKKKREQ